MLIESKKYKEEAKEKKEKKEREKKREEESTKELFKVFWLKNKFCFVLCCLFVCFCKNPRKRTNEWMNERRPAGVRLSRELVSRLLACLLAGLACISESNKWAWACFQYELVFIDSAHNQFALSRGSFEELWWRCCWWLMVFVYACVCVCICFDGWWYELKERFWDINRV